MELERVGNRGTDPGDPDLCTDLRRLYCGGSCAGGGTVAPCTFCEWCGIFAGCIAVGAALEEVQWLRALSVSGVAFVLSILTALGGLPEVQKEPIELDPPDAEE